MVVVFLKTVLHLGCRVKFHGSAGGLPFCTRGNPVLEIAGGADGKSVPASSDGCFEKGEVRLASVSTKP